MYLDNDVWKHGSPSAMTSSNIVGKFETLAGQISSEVYDNPNFKWLLAGANRPHYTQAQQNQTNKGVDFTQAGKLEFDGKPIVIVNGMSPNTLFGGKASRNMESNPYK